MSLMEMRTLSIVLYPNSLMADSFSLNLCLKCQAQPLMPIKGLHLQSERSVVHSRSKIEGQLSEEGLPGLEEQKLDGTSSNNVPEGTRCRGQETWDLILTSPLAD